MAYVDGFVTAVPTANKATYRAHAEAAMALFREFGATRLVEAWGDDVPRGKVNDFYGAVAAKDDETVVFSWIEYPDRPTRNAAGQKMMSDPRMAALGEMPFDGSRMIYSGFAPGLDKGGGRGTYAEGLLIPVAPGRKDAYFDLARQVAPIFLEHGALRVVEAWGDDVVHGKTTDFFRAVHAEGDETVAFAWIEWPDRAAYDAGHKAMMADERMKDPPADMPFDGRRMIFGGFVILVDSAAS